MLQLAFLNFPLICLSGIVDAVEFFLLNGPDVKGHQDELFAVIRFQI